MTQYKHEVIYMSMNHKTYEPEEELNYRAAYLRLFGDIAALTERMEAAGARFSIGEVHDSLAQALARAEDAACG